MPSQEIKQSFSNLQKVLGSPITTFKASYPSQKPRQVVQSNESGDVLLETSVYKLDILSLPVEITKRHLLKMQGSASLYQPTVAVGPDLIGRNINLELKLIN